VRERLSEIDVPTLVVHGRRDPFFPVGNGEALAREISGARLLVLEAGEVAEAMLALGWRMSPLPGPRAVSCVCPRLHDEKETPISDYRD
jgi:hypothetical protein